MDAQRSAEPVASASSLALPSFGGTWSGGELARPDVPADPRPHPAAAPRAASDPTPWPLYAMIAVLSLAVLALGVLVLLRTPAPVVTAAVVPEVAPRVDAVAEAPPAEQPAVSAAAVVPGSAVPEATRDEPADAAVEAPAEVVARTERRRPRRPKNKPTAQGTTPAPTGPKPGSKGAVPVACVIDPASCGRGTSEPGPTGNDGTRPKPTGPLPDTPSNAQVRAAMAKVKAKAKACGRRHQLASGTTVRVKLSVVGATGRIKSARAIEEHADRPAGRCVAEALSAAVLPRFAKPQAGIVYGIRM